MTEYSAAPDDLAPVGYVSGAYGVAGMVRVHPFSEDAGALLGVQTWWLDKPTLHAVTARNAKLHGGDVVVQLLGVVGRDVAEALKGASVQIARSAFPALPEDEYYWSDLIGLAVVNMQGDALGQVADMMHNGAQSILRVAPAAQADDAEKVSERLIPFVEQFVKTVDVSGKKIVVDWGLDY